MINVSFIQICCLSEIFGIQHVMLSSNMLIGIFHIIMILFVIYSNGAYSCHSGTQQWRQNHSTQYKYSRFA